MDLNNLVAESSRYHVFIAAGSVPIYQVLTGSAVGRQLSRDADNIPAIGAVAPIATKMGMKKNSFSISLQDGEAALIIAAAKAVLGDDINDFRDFPKNTNITVVDTETGHTEKYIGCRFSADNRNVERNTLETIRELSGMCLDYKAI